MTAPLPDSWLRVEIGEVAKVVGGGTPPAADPGNFATPGTGTPWLTPADLSGYRGQYVSGGARDLSSAGLATSSAKLLPKGAVLFSSRAPIGYVAIAAVDLATNQGFKSFVFEPGVEPRFAYYQLRHLKPVAEAMATGTTFKELSGSVAARLPFVVAPAVTQQRIADKLDTVLARVDACRARLARVALLLKRFRQSVLAAAMSGRLTEDWREIPRSGVQLSKAAWRTTDLRSCIRRMTGGASPSSDDYTRVGILVLNKGDIKPYGEIRLREPANRVPMSIASEHEAKLVRTSALLVTLRDLSNKADFLGLMGIYLGKESALPTQGMCALEVHDEVLPAYLMYFSNSPIYRAMVKREKVGATQVHLRNDQFLGIPIALPSKIEQVEIVRRVETLFAFADRLEACLSHAQTAVDRVSPSLLAKAFRGELVPQDPNDEPASELLRRLHSEASSNSSSRNRANAA